MNKERFLSRRWNILISLVQGIPTFTFALIAILTDISYSLGGMIALSVAGSLFCLILEYHSSVRFAAEWKKQSEENPGLEKPGPKPLVRVLLVIHNLAFWFFLIPLFTRMSYRIGFITFASILFFRFLANSYMNLKDFDAARYYRFPFRIP